MLWGWGVAGGDKGAGLAESERLGGNRVTVMAKMHAS